MNDVSFDSLESDWLSPREPESRETARRRADVSAENWKTAAANVAWVGVPVLGLTALPSPKPKTKARETRKGKRAQK